MGFRVPICVLVCVFFLAVSKISASETVEAEAKEFVITLDHSNFSETVAKHDFIVVEFYAPWCGHCKKLAPEYEKAASVLSSHEPQVVLAKVDLNEEKNKVLATEYEIKGFPTLKILRNGGKSIQEYKGPRDADGIVAYLKKQSGPASFEIKSADDASSLISDSKIVVVGIFSEFSGEKYENFVAVADKLRSDYDFCHTLDAKFLPRGDSSVTAPTVRLFKPFDELFVDSEEFNVDALEKFVEEASVPVVTIFNQDPNNHPFVVKFFNNPGPKAMLFLNFSSDIFDGFKAKYHEVSESYKGKGLGFLMGDIESSQGAFQYFGLKEEQVPVIVVQTDDGKKYVKANLELDQIAAWLKDFQEGKVAAFKKSEPIPEVNDEPVKVVVADSLEDVVFKSGKNVLLEFYAPWCGHCKKLAPILDEVAVALQSEEDVIIAKIDGTANDVPSETFEVKGYPTLYFKTSGGSIISYDGDRTKEDIIEFIKKNRNTTPTTTTTTTTTPVEEEEEDSVKDEL